MPFRSRTSAPGRALRGAAPHRVGATDRVPENAPWERDWRLLRHAYWYPHDPHRGIERRRERGSPHPDPASYASARLQLTASAPLRTLRRLRSPARVAELVDALVSGTSG